MKSIRLFILFALLSAFAFSCGNDIEYLVILNYDSVVEAGNVEAYQLSNGTINEIDVTPCEAELEYNVSENRSSIVQLSETEAQVVTNDTTLENDYVIDGDSYIFAGEDGKYLTIDFTLTGDENELLLPARTLFAYGGIISFNVSAPCMASDGEDFCGDIAELIDPTENG